MVTFCQAIYRGGIQYELVHAVAAIKDKAGRTAERRQEKAEEREEKKEV